MLCGPSSTVILFREGTVLPFDIALVRGISYKTDGAGEPTDAEISIGVIAGQLRVARENPHPDSPIFQLVDVIPHSQIDHTKTDIFRESVDYSRKYKERLAAAVRQGADAVQKIASEQALKNLYEVETGIIVDLFLSLRDVKAYPAMIDLYNRMPPPLAARQNDARAVRLRSQPRGAIRGGGKGAQRRDRGVRSIQRNQRAARPHLQGPLGNRQGGKAAGGARSAAASHRHLPRTASRRIGATPIRA